MVVKTEGRDVSKRKVSEVFEPTPPDWDPLLGAPAGEDQSAVLPPAALRLFEEEVNEIRMKQREREEADDE
ncbi:MAG TPA: hypothetical protein VG053_03940 [Solirubrobacteraceae bacterium]|jgi:hypothetical protein|nr:hypothetical protein [Solirubrobacteraceae bacterium]